MFQFEMHNQSIRLDPFGFHTRVTDRPVMGMNLYEKIRGCFICILEGIESRR